MPAEVTAIPTKEQRVKTIGIMMSWMYWLGTRNISGEHGPGFGIESRMCIDLRSLVFCISLDMVVNTYGVQTFKVITYSKIRNVHTKRGVNPQRAVQSAQPRPTQRGPAQRCMFRDQTTSRGRRHLHERPNEHRKLERQKRFSQRPSKRGG